MLITLLLALLLPVGQTTEAISDDALFLVEEFERYYPRQEHPAQRREAILTLRDASSLRATVALMPALEDEEYLVRRAAIDVLCGYTDPAAGQFLVEGVLEDRKLKKNDRLVAAVAEVLGGMRYEAALGRLQALLEHDELSVRLGATNGLGRMGRVEAVSSLAWLIDPDNGAEEALQVAAVRALEQIGNVDAARPALLVALARGSKPVQIAAVAAAHALPHKDLIAPLIELLDESRDPRVAEDAHGVLVDITLRTFPDTKSDWQTWWLRAVATWVLPDAELVKAARARLATQGSKYATGKSFQGIETKSDNILFVIDVSESMNQPFGDPERLEQSGRTYKSNQRLDIVKEELIGTIEALPETTAFNIVSFATAVEHWKKRPATANVLNKSNAQSWVDDLEPLGGAATTFRARAGLAGGGGEAVGQTNTHLALMTAFGEEVEKKKKRKRAKPRELVTELSDPIDTIYFLTDGEPTVGVTTDMNEIRDEVRRLNGFRGVQLHVIYVGTHGGGQFKLLAEENGGVFVSVGS
ncbi:MAG: hypothetical protein DHS20C15_03410 [Planctomycetota bacterium]|nr:MAG: hypothetical protein DHS20C15_03410 [Planctomycetota bacterium]